MTDEELREYKREWRRKDREKKREERELKKKMKACTDPVEKKRIKDRISKRHWRKRYYKLHPDKAQEKRKKQIKRAGQKYYYKRKAKLFKEELKAEIKERHHQNKLINNAIYYERHKVDRSIQWKVVTTRRNRFVKTLLRCHGKEDAMEFFENTRKRCDEEIQLPILSNSYTRTGDAKYECLLLKKINEGENQDNPYFRNEYGEMVEHEIDGEKGTEWTIVNKFDYKEEELFKLIGHERKGEWKDINWIMENEVYPNLTIKTEPMELQVCCKMVVMRKHFRPVQVIYTKSHGEAVRVCNYMIERLNKEKKQKLFIFIGGTNERSVSERLKTEISSIKDD